MPTKSLYQQISNPIETYTDGYGQTREVYEPKYVGVLRKAYNAANRLLNGPSEEEFESWGMKKPNTSSGVIEFITFPEVAALKYINVASTKNLPKTYKAAVSEFNKLRDARKIRGKWSKQEQSRVDFLNELIWNVKYAADDVAVERTKKAWKEFDKKLEMAEKSPKPEMIWSDFEQAYIPSYNLWYKPGRVQADPEEIWEFMYKNAEMKEKETAVAKEAKQLKQMSKKAKDANNYTERASDPEATINYSAEFFKDGFHYKQGGNMPSSIDILVEKFNRQFNK